MPIYEKRIISEQARQLGFQASTFEKVSRLTNILQFMNETSELKETLALKGGTAINLTIFNLPRLSVDIDLDFTKNLNKEGMQLIRKKINDMLNRYMVTQGYLQSNQSKQTPILDSLVYTYVNTSGNADNIKVEINYALRCHVLPLIDVKINTSDVFTPFVIRSLDPLEIFASKIVALTSRAAARDLYDLNNMIYFGLFNESELELLHKCAVFYLIKS